MKPSARYLFAFAATVAVLYFGGAIAAHFLFHDIAPNFTGDRAFNQKMKYLRDHPGVHAPVAVAIGSSMALTNVDTDILQASTGEPWINLGMWGLSVKETNDVYDLFKGLFPVKEVVFATQYFELTDTDREVMTVDRDVFRDYIQGHFGWIREFAYRDLLDAMRQRIAWKSLGGNPHNPESLAFSSTGAGPIDIYDGPGGPSRWSQFENYIGNCGSCTDNIESLCREVRSQNIPFTVFFPPLTRASLGKPLVRKWYEFGRARARDVVARCGGSFFDAADVAEFSDNCFFDFAHLNNQGMHVLGELFVKWRRHNIVGVTQVECTASGQPVLEPK
jgi:hypothetical protein